MKPIPNTLKTVFTIAFALLLEAFVSNINAATYTVTNTGDNGGIDPAAYAGTGTLRQAIVDANATAGSDVINFNITGTGPFTITLSGLLPLVTGPIAINGYSQPAAIQGAIGSRTIMIAINGNSITGRDGLFRFTSTAGASSLSGLSIYNSGQDVEAITIEPGSSNIHIWGNYIGFMPNGTSPVAATDFNGDDGVLLGDYSMNTGAFTSITIGTNGDGLNDANEGNAIGNSKDATMGGDGIQVGIDNNSYTWSDIKISGNYIGIDPNGITAAPNGLPSPGTTEPKGQNGINVRGATNILIGTDGNNTSDVLERNIIAGNTGNGIEINRTSSNINIAGNYIGTDKTGLMAVPNGIKSTSSVPFCGILVIGTTGNASGVVIGFDDTKHTAANAAVTRNIISGNQGVGIQFSTITGASNKIAGNYIGVDATGNAALGNGRVNIAHPSVVVHSVGVDIFATRNLLVGTDADGDDDVYERNVIAGNIDSRGVYVRSASSLNAVAGNYIGVGADGVTAIGNDFSGIHIDASNNNRIGSNDDGANDAAEANTIADNGKSVNVSNQSSDGVRITANATQNRLSRNIFYNNKATPIDLVNNGVSVNDGVTTAAQPNILLDYPVFTAYSISGTTMTVSGYVGQCNGTETGAGTTIGGTTIVQVYKEADDGDQNAAFTGGGCSRIVSHGEGVQYLGSISVVNGLFTNASFTLSAGATFLPSDKITGITIDASGNTSEFGVVSDAITILPVTLESFTVVVKDCNTVTLNWKVSDAVNFSHFEVERSLNGTDFISSEVIPYDASLSDYHYNETNTSKGNYQYRLKMIDKEGNVKYSSVVYARLDCNQQRTLLVYPNPVKDKLTINGLNIGEQVTMYNARGQLIYTKQSTAYQWDINMSGFKNGMYYIIVTNENGKRISESKIAKIE